MAGQKLVNPDIWYEPVLPPTSNTVLYCWSRVVVIRVISVIPIDLGQFEIHRTKVPAVCA